MSPCVYLLFRISKDLGACSGMTREVMLGQLRAESFKLL